MKTIKVDGKYTTVLEKSDINNYKSSTLIPRAMNEDEPSDERRGEE